MSDSHEPVPGDTTASADVPASEDPQRVGAGRIILGFAFSLFSAVLLFVMWNYTFNLWPLVFIAFVPMYVAAYRLFPRKLAPFAFAIAAFGYWLALLLQGGGVLPPAVVYLASLLIAAFWFLLAIFERKFTERTNYKWFIVQLPLLWVGLEVIFEGNLLLGSNYWIAYRLGGAPEIIQPVSLVSTPALGFLIIMFNAVIALLVLKLMDKRWPNMATVKIPSITVTWSAVTTFGLTIVWVATSLVIFTNVSNEMGPAVRVAAAQSGIKNTTSSGQLGEGGAQGTPEDNARNARLQVQMTRMTTDAANQGAKLVVWPEEELDYNIKTNKAAWVGELAKATQTTIVAGYEPLAPDLTSPNRAAVWYPDGTRATQVYSKQHQVVAEGEAFASGTINPVYQTDFGRLGVIICFDHDFPDSSTVAAGANIMAAPAIDPYTISHLRWQSLVFRAVENRVPFVKTDVGFDSAIVDANGVVRDRISVDDEAGREALLVADVHIGPRGAPFTSTGGYVFGWFVVVALVARYIRQIYLWRRERRA